MKTMKDLEYRMYGLVPYSLSAIQQGIQFGHAVVEYMLKFPMDLEIYNSTKKWAEEDKTFIILNGGTTSKQSNFDTGLPHGTINQHALTLRENNILFATFNEPDLGDQLTAVVFLVDERVWDKEKYPDFEYDFDTAVWTKKASQDYQLEQWVESVGGEKNVFLREFLKQFRLA